MSPSAAMQFQIQNLPSHEKAREDKQLSLPKLPRKLRLLEEVSSNYYHGVEGFTPDNNQKEEMSGGEANKKEENKVDGRRGTWQEWMEKEDDTSHKYYFTMDYSGVRKRRPIHNKALPLGP